MQVSHVNQCEREHASTEFASAHWIIKSNFGRWLLLDRLRWVQPHRRFSFIRLDLDLFPDLERMVDELGFRHWPEPRTRTQRLRACVFLLACAVRLSMGLTASEWKRHFSEEH